MPHQEAPVDTREVDAGQDAGEEYLSAELALTHLITHEYSGPRSPRWQILELNTRTLMTHSTPNVKMNYRMLEDSALFYHLARLKANLSFSADETENHVKASDAQDVENAGLQILSKKTQVVVEEMTRYMKIANRKYPIHTGGTLNFRFKDGMPTLSIGADWKYSVGVTLLLLPFGILFISMVIDAAFKSPLDEVSVFLKSLLLIS